MKPSDALATIGTMGAMICRAEREAEALLAWAKAGAELQNWIASELDAETIGLSEAGALANAWATVDRCPIPLVTPQVLTPEPRRTRSDAGKARGPRKSAPPNSEMEALLRCLANGPAAKEQFGEDGPATLAGLSLRMASQGVHLDTDELCALIEKSPLVSWEARREGDEKPVRLFGTLGQFAGVLRAVIDGGFAVPNTEANRRDSARLFGCDVEQIERAIALS